MKVYYSPSTNEFYKDDWLQLYIDAGTLPNDLVEITNELYLSFLGAAPEGKTRGSVEGMPAWVNYPEPSNDEKKKQELQDLSTQYKSDIQELNAAWLAAAVNDGENEISKKDIVFSEITDRKTKYATERAEIISKYQ